LTRSVYFRHSQAGFLVDILVKMQGKQLLICAFAAAWVPAAE